MRFFPDGGRHSDPYAKHRPKMHADLHLFFWLALTLIFLFSGQSWQGAKGQWAARIIGGVRAEAILLVHIE